jgi:2-hydroxychromene-2-carboxylate isomerase
MLLGGVFRSIGAGDGPMATLAPIKAVHNARDMARWAERRGMRVAMPAAHPMRTVRALRTLLALPGDTWAAAMHALYAAYWVDGHDVTDDAVIARGADRRRDRRRRPSTAALAAADSDAIKDELRTRTDRAVALGAFGAPAIVVHRDGAAPLLLWGQDRLHWLAAVLDGWDPDGGPPPRRPSADPALVGAPLSPRPGDRLLVRLLVAVRLPRRDPDRAAWRGRRRRRGALAADAARRAVPRPRHRRRAAPAHARGQARYVARELEQLGPVVGRRLPLHVAVPAAHGAAAAGGAPGRRPHAGAGRAGVPRGLGRGSRRRRSRGGARGWPARSARSRRLVEHRRAGDQAGADRRHRRGARRRGVRRADRRSSTAPVARWRSGGRIASIWSRRRCAAGAPRPDDRRRDRVGGVRGPGRALVRAERQDDVRGRFRWKPMASAAFVAVPLAGAASPTGSISALAMWIIVGLALGAVGDVALMFESERGFLGGLVAFLLGHLAYVIGLARVVAPAVTWFDGAMGVRRRSP